MVNGTGTGDRQRAICGKSTEGRGNAGQQTPILHQSELNKLISAARKGRYGHRDATLILLMARHGLRVTEAVDLQWDQIDFTRAHLHVRRLKGGTASVHPIQGDELRALRELSVANRPARLCSPASAVAP